MCKAPAIDSKVKVGLIICPEICERIDLRHLKT
jgi:hypothetical protein